MVQAGYSRDPGRASSMKGLRRAVRARMMRQATDLAHDLTHIVRVWRNADRIATHEAAHGHVIDGDVLEAAVWLHEMGRGTEHAGETAADACVRVADELMRVVDLSELVWPVCEVLISHLAEGREPETPEGRVLRDADWLDDLGAIGVARAFLGAEHQMAPALYDMEDPAAVRRTPDPSAFLLDLFPGQLRLLPERFATAWGQAEAGRRIAVVDAFHRAILRDCSADSR